MFKEGDKVVILSQGGGAFIQHHLVVGSIATVVSKPYKYRDVYRLYGIDDHGYRIHQTASAPTIMKWHDMATTNVDAVHLLRNDHHV
jgi:phosphodiesterase/alkaline phosphatase D-like protein